MNTEVMIRHFFDSYHPHGGFTYCYKIVNNVLYVGIAYCSNKDIYSRKHGRNIAKNNLDAILNSSNDYVIKSRFIIGFKTQIENVFLEYLAEFDNSELFSNAFNSMICINDKNEPIISEYIKKSSDEFSDMIYYYHYSIERRLLTDGNVINSLVKYDPVYK